MTGSATNDLVTIFQSLQTSLDAHRPRQGVGREAPANRTPVTVLTGFLGAGKSTLLAALLSSPPDGLVIKAVVNDVGDLSFDPSLIAEDGPLDVELSNGCGCCSGAGELGAALDRASESRPDLIVLEASGLTDPFAVAQIVGASELVQLDRVVAVVSATALPAQLADDLLRPTIARQIEAAETVIVSRADRLDQAGIRAAIEQVAALAPGRVVSPSSLDGELPLQMLVPQGLRGAALPARDDSTLSHSFVSALLSQELPIGRDELDLLLSSRPQGIVRCKGVLATTGNPVAVQWTTDGWTAAEVDGHPDAGLLVVGRSFEDISTFARAAGLSSYETSV